MNFISALLSLFIPGSGQVLHREHEQGLIIFGLWILWLFLSKYFFELDLIFVFIGWSFFSVYSSFDALIFNSKKIKREDSQLKEFDEMRNQKEKEEEYELKATKILLEKELNSKYDSFQILEIKKDKGEIKVKAVIQGKFVELNVSKNGEIISMK